jgi:hypothetical protein
MDGLRRVRACGYRAKLVQACIFFTKGIENRPQRNVLLEHFVHELDAATAHRIGLGDVQLRLLLVRPGWIGLRAVLLANACLLQRHRDAIVACRCNVDLERGLKMARWRETGVERWMLGDRWRETGAERWMLGDRWRETAFTYTRTRRVEVRTCA